MPKILAIIPARGGSKGVPGKNIRIIDGEPLIHYTINTALSVLPAADIVVSSDSKDIINIAKQYDISIHERDSSLATDNSPVSETVDTILSLYEKKNGCKYDYIMLLQPTSPLRETQHLLDAIESIKNCNFANSLISVCEMHDVHPARMYNIKDRVLSPIIAKYETLRRQDIPPAYYRNGSIYITQRDAFSTQKQIMAKPSIPFIMDSKYLLNIDEPRDIILAEVFIKLWKEGSL